LTPFNFHAPRRKGFKVFGKDDLESMRQEYAGKGGEL
jgi:hypothetical protein